MNTQLALYATGPTARPSDPETSLAAVPSEDRLSALRAEVLALVAARPLGMTQDEVCVAMPHRCEGTLKKRVTELVHANRLADSGLKRPTRTGRLAVVWSVTA